MLREGLQYTCRLMVTPEQTAEQIGSGDLPVLATPAMLALMEHAAMLAVAEALPEGQTTVGGYIESSHIKPTAVNREVTATAILERIEDRKLYFQVSACEGEVFIGEGTHLRFVVDKAKFLSKLS